MTEQITQDQIDFQERFNAGTSPTNNEQFDRDGYLILKNFWDPKDFDSQIPEIKGEYRYFGKLNKFSHSPLQKDSQFLVSRYFYPPYKFFHSQLRLKIENEIGKKLYNTYYADYFYDQESKPLKTHCMLGPESEICLNIHVGNDLNTSWPIWIKTPDTYDDPIKKTNILKRGEIHSVILNPGDAILYKGCERPCWREPLPGKNKKTWYGKEVKIEDNNFYYHQILFHYILADGLRVEHVRF